MPLLPAPEEAKNANGVASKTVRGPLQRLLCAQKSRLYAGCAGAIGSMGSLHLGRLLVHTVHNTRGVASAMAKGVDDGTTLFLIV